MLTNAVFLLKHHSKEVVVWWTVLSVCTCDYIYIANQRIMPLKNFWFEDKFSHVLMCSFQRPGRLCGYVPWYSAEYFATLKKWCWVTYHCQKVYFTDTTPPFGTWSSDELFVLKLHSVLKPRYIIWCQKGRASWDSSKCSYLIKLSKPLPQNHRWSNTVGWSLRYEALQFEKV